MDEKIYKVGPKEKHVTIPDGWFQVTSGVCQKDDRFARTDNGKFEFVTDEEIGDKYDTFELLIRRKQ